MSGHSSICLSNMCSLQIRESAFPAGEWQVPSCTPILYAIFHLSEITGKLHLGHRPSRTSLLAEGPVAPFLTLAARRQRCSVSQPGLGRASPGLSVASPLGIPSQPPFHPLCFFLLLFLAFPLEAPGGATTAVDSGDRVPPQDEVLRRRERSPGALECRLEPCTPRSAVVQYTFAGSSRVAPNSWPPGFSEWRLFGRFVADVTGLGGTPNPRSGGCMRRGEDVQ